MTRLSAVVQLIDGYLGQPAVGVAARFELDGKAVQAWPKADAFYAFVDLAAGHHKLQIACQGYFDHEVELDVPIDLKPPHTLAEAIKTCQLEPSPLYAYPAQSTLLRGLVRDACSGMALAGVSVSAAYKDARQRARTRQTSTGGEGRFLGRYALALTGRVAEGTVAVLKFSRDGYAGATQQLPIHASAASTLDVGLVPQATAK